MKQSPVSYRFQAPDPRTVTSVHRAEDGWDIEVEDERGIRLTYWFASTSDYVPQIGDTAHFYGGVAGVPLHEVEINGCHVRYDASGEQDEAAD
jgi:hypothetical protein